VTSVGVALTEMDPLNQGQARYAQEVAGTTQTTGINAREVWQVTNVQDGATITFGHYGYNQTANQAFFAFPFATIKFTPYVADRVTKIVMA
jgi:hypothetical protein